MTSEPTQRARRVAESVKRVVTDFLARDVSDPALVSVAVTDVVLTPDLGIATVKVRLFVGGDDPGSRRSVMKSLSRVAGRVRKRLGDSLRLKRVPELKFAYDVGADATRRVDELLADIAKEKRGD